MMRIIIGLGIVGLGLLIYSLIECLQTPRHRIRVMPKVAWIAVIVLLPIIGASLWLGFGRVRAPKKGAAASRRPRSPDDDPDFLRQIEIQRRQRQRAEERRQRDAEQRRKERELNAGRQQDPEKQLGDAADAAVAGDSATGDSDPRDASPEAERGPEEKPKKTSDDDDDGPSPAPKA